MTHLNVVRPDESKIEPESGAQPMFPGPLNKIKTPTFDARLVGPKSWTTICGTRPRNPGATIPYTALKTHMWANECAVSHREN
jgi:hypothetical protein